MLAQEIIQRAQPRVCTARRVGAFTPRGEWVYRGCSAAVVAGLRDRLASRAGQIS